MQRLERRQRVAMKPEVTIGQGTLRGSVAKDLRGNSFFKFQGIPYAKPPLGKLRFKAPQPPESWSGVLDATKEGNVCYSSDFMKNGKISGSEDCLFLNVYTKKISNQELKSPVFFWIHGGGFTFGSGNEEQYGPEFLMTEDVVLVTINYRLGLLGFINFKDPALDIPGNAGFKDQVMALKWVQTNISKFGGDADNVTIFGNSAGASSVHLLMLSPMARNLFHKAVVQGACALSPWAHGTTSTKLVAKAMGLDGSDDKTMYDTLMKKSVQEIFEIQQKLEDRLLPSFHRLIGFVVEKNSKEPFLDDEPMNIMKTGSYSQVPLMIGYNSSEGMIFEMFKKPDDPQEPDWENMVPWVFGYGHGTDESRHLARKIKQFYLGNQEYSEKLVPKKYDLFSDTMLVHGIYLTIVTHLETSKFPIYFYKMLLETKLNTLKTFLKITEPGACHSDELGYLFKSSFAPEINPGSEESTFVTRFVKMWTNFAKCGNPTPENDPLLKIVWKPVTNLDLDYLDIGRELVLRSNPDSERMNFWNELLTEKLARQDFSNFEKS